MIRQIQLIKSFFIITVKFFLVATLLTGCASNPLPQDNKKISYAFRDYSDTELYKYAQSYEKENEGLTGFYPLGDGQAALIARLALIEGAQKSIDLQSYIYSEDETSLLVAWYLYEAAERGVRVRVLLDDMQQRNDAVIASLSAHPNIEVRYFNPFPNRAFKNLGFLHDFSRLNNRMHNKLMVSDGAFVITGGRNVADEYFDANFDVEFGDLDLLMKGKIVPEMSKKFDEYWNSEPAIPIESIVKNVKRLKQEEVAKWKNLKIKYLTESNYIQSLKTHPMIAKLIDGTIGFYWSDAKLVYDPPVKVLGDKQRLLIDDLFPAIKNAKEEIILISPYFVPTAEGTAELIAARKRGVKVLIVTNSLASNDVAYVHGWYAKYRKALISAGVELYETKVESIDKISTSHISEGKSSLHAKLFILDKRDVFVGSFNFDPRSAYSNTEMGVFVDSPSFANLLIEEIEALLHKTAYRLRLDQEGDIEWLDTLNNIAYDSEPYSSLWLNWLAALAGVLPVEDLL